MKREHLKMSRQRGLRVLLWSWSALAFAGAGAETSPLRDLSADRPDATESPVTVDAGHVQIETSVFDWRREGRDDVYTLMATNLKYGLNERTDLQLVWDSYVFENGAGAAAEGFGDVTFRLKYNLWGNDGGESAFALFPFVKIPTGAGAGNGEWEGGLILPYARELSADLSLGLMAEVDFVAAADGGHGFEFVHTAVLGRELPGPWGAYAEYIGLWAEDRYEASLAGGLSYALGENFL
ncbi:MAG: transporter, partial [Verrucomicrobiales bacterium]